MFDLRYPKWVSSLSLSLLFLASCSNPSVTALSISPTSETLAIGNTAQFTATATLSQGTHPKSTQDMTTSVSWKSSNPGVATISDSGLATAVAPGTTIITANTAGFPGTISASASVTVTSPSSGGGSDPALISLSLIPNSQTATAVNETTQFIAIGTYAGNPGTTVDLTGQATWSSSDTNIATVNPNTGLVTAKGQGTTTITAIATNPAGGVVTGSATFTVTVASVSQSLQSLSIIPTSQTVLSLGEKSQFIAIGSYGGNPATTVNLTNQVTWGSSDASVATIDSSGVITATGAGTTTVTAIATDPNTQNVVTGTATFTVTIPASTEPLLSLTIIPGSQSVGTVNETGQFIAIGTFSSAPTTRDVTSQVTWTSSDPKVATINASGLATGLNTGSTAITAIYKEPDGSLVTGAASFSESSAGAGIQMATLTIVPAGANAPNGDVVSTDSTGALQVIHCGPGLTGGSVCVGTFPLGSTVTLTATPELGSGASFYGWSSNCTVNDPTKPNVCTVTLSDNDTVGAIFN